MIFHVELGLGRGLLIGYGFGLMTRPVRYRRAPSENNKDAYKKPLHCTFANSTLYFKVGNDTQVKAPEFQMICS